MVFSCFCSYKKYLEEDVSIPRQLTSEKILSINKKIKLIDEFNKTIHEWDLNEKIVGQCLCKMYIVVCTEKVILVYDQVTFEEVKRIEMDETILCCSAEKVRNYFYIGCKSGLLYVYVIRNLETKILVTEIWKFYCFKPIYDIMVQVERKTGLILERKIFAGFSKWGNKSLQLISNYKLLTTYRTIIPQIHPNIHTIIMKSMPTR